MKSTNSRVAVSLRDSALRVCRGVLRQRLRRRRRGGCGGGGGVLLALPAPSAAEATTAAARQLLASIATDIEPYSGSVSAVYVL
jgi:hypothetical protein